MTLSSANPSASEERVDYRRLWWVALLALAAALLANGLLRALALVVLDVPPEFNPLVTPSFAGLTTFGVIGAVIVYALLGRFSRRPVRTFSTVAFVVLLLSFIPDIGLLLSGAPGATLASVVVLMLMHVVAYAITVGLLTRLARV